MTDMIKCQCTVWYLQYRCVCVMWSVADIIMVRIHFSLSLLLLRVRQDVGVL
jgi:hypothetical protein